MLRRTIEAPVQSRSPILGSDPLLIEYFAHEWGRAVRDESGVFEQLALQIFQTGLSWLTILKKRDALGHAFENFDVEKIALFSNERIAELLLRSDIVRNRRKVQAVVIGAQAALRLRSEGTNIADLVWSYRPESAHAPVCATEMPSSSAESVALAKDLKSRGFMFVGPTNMFALMAAIGVVDTHIAGSEHRGISRASNTGSVHR